MCSSDLSVILRATRCFATTQHGGRCSVNMDTADCWKPTAERSPLRRLEHFACQLVQDGLAHLVAFLVGWELAQVDVADVLRCGGLNSFGQIGVASGVLVQEVGEQAQRSEERRVGKECRSRWSPYP
mgnify:CR=1 FL=1